MSDYYVRLENSGECMTKYLCINRGLISFNYTRSYNHFGRFNKLTRVSTSVYNDVIVDIRLGTQNKIPLQYELMGRRLFIMMMLR